MSKWDFIVEEMRLEDDGVLLESKDRLIDRLPSLNDAQKSRMKRFFAKRPSLESKFDWNRPETITWDAFQELASKYKGALNPLRFKELSNPRDEGDGIMSYEVRDDEDGMMASRKIVDSHWGKDANPWCLIDRMDDDEEDEEDALDVKDWWESLSFAEQKEILRKDGYDEDAIMGRAKLMLMDHDFGPEAIREYMNLPEEEWSEHWWWRDLDERMMTAVNNGYVDQFGRDEDTKDPEMRRAFSFWKRYRSLPKRMAFKDGRLLAFMATDAEGDAPEKWWDRKNGEHPSVHDCV